MDDPILISAPDPNWPALFRAEQQRLLSALPVFLALEHIGSTAVPGLCAKPVIDIMAAADRLGAVADSDLAALGYGLLQTDMKNRLLYVSVATPDRPRFHLHIVETATWPTRNERLLRDHLRQHPLDAEAYGMLKLRLAAKFPEDRFAYTKAKTALIQSMVDRARTARGLPRENVWQD